MLGSKQLGANPAFMHASYYNKPSFRAVPQEGNSDIEMSTVREEPHAKVPDTKEKGWVRRHDPNYDQVSVSESGSDELTEHVLL